MMQRSQMMMRSPRLHWQTQTEGNSNRKRKNIHFIYIYIHTYVYIFRHRITIQSHFPLLFLLRTQFKKFLGKSVKKAKHLAEEYGEKAVNKVKSVRDEGKRKTDNDLGAIM